VLVLAQWLVLPVVLLMQECPVAHRLVACPVALLA
jgi:hypothetical protein